MDGWTRQGTRNQRKSVYGSLWSNSCGVRIALCSFKARIDSILAKRAKNIYNFYYLLFWTCICFHFFWFWALSLGICSWIQNPFKHVKSATISDKHKVITPIRRTQDINTYNASILPYYYFKQHHFKDQAIDIRVRISFMFTVSWTKVTKVSRLNGAHYHA